MSLDAKTARLFRDLPIPAPGEAPHSWVIDTTGVDVTSKTWPAHQCPYEYTPKGVWLRLAMGRSKRRADTARRLLSELVHMAQGEVHDLVNLPHDSDITDVATMVMVLAVLADRSSPFVIVTVWPGGRAEFWSRRYPDLVLYTPHIDQPPEGWDR